MTKKEYIVAVTAGVAIGLILAQLLIKPVEKKPTENYPSVTIDYIRIVTLTPSPTPTPAKKTKAELDRIVAGIYRWESSNGKNDPCVRDGRGFNGYGYRPGKCYGSHKEITKIVTLWFDKCLNQNGYSLAHCACSYNLGPRSADKPKCESQSTERPYLKNLVNYL